MTSSIRGLRNKRTRIVKSRFLISEERLLRALAARRQLSVSALIRTVLMREARVELGVEWFHAAPSSALADITITFSGREDDC